MPFCPKCKDEYRTGFIECATCHVRLVDKLPEEEQLYAETGFEAVPTEVETSSLKFITVFVADEIQEADIVREILSENNIPYITRGQEEMQSPYVDFLVREDRIEEARRLLKDIIDKESTGIDTTPVMDQNMESDFKASVAPNEFSQPQKQRSNLYVFLLVGAIIGFIFVSGLEKFIKYILSGILVIFLLMKVVYSSDKKL